MSQAPLAETMPHPSEEKELRLLLDACLSPEDVCRASEDLPLLIGDFCSSEREVRRDESGKIISHAALYTHTVEFHGLTLRIGVIGAVATDPSARGRGLAREVVLALCESAGRSAHDAVLLWPQVEGYYERMGFVWAGEEVIVALPPEGQELPDGILLREARPDDLPALMAIHETSEGSPRRDRFIWNAQLSIPLCEWYVLEERGVVTAYAVVGKGRDLGDCIHEIVGPELAVPDLALAVARHRGGEQTLLMLPPHRRATRMLFESMGLPIHIGPLALMHIPRPARLWRRLGLPGEIPAELGADQERLAREIFGPPPGEPIDRSLPLPLYLSGLDSM